MSRLVIYRGFQYDADNLPAHVDASECVDADEWFRSNAKRTAPPAEDSTADADAADADATPAGEPKARKAR